jgi:predicted ATPase
MTMHSFQNFKNFTHAENLDLFNPLTVLIGSNGVGKSNLLEAIELLGFLANGGLLHEISDMGQNGKIEVRGGLQASPSNQEKRFSLRFSGSVHFGGIVKKFQYEISICTNEPQAFICNEVLQIDEKPLFKTIESSSSVHTVEYNHFSRGGKKPQASISPIQSALSQYKAFAIKNKKFSESLNVVNTIQHHLKASFIFDPNPKLMREYERIGNRILVKNGANLSAVLYGLSNGTEEEKQSLSRLLNWIQHLPDEPYERFEFVVVKQLNDVIFGFKIQETGELMSAKVLSDGTLRCLAVLTALETVDTHSRIVIEEFDNGLHPSRVKVLVEAIEECCTRRKLNVLVTTHNPATLNTLSKKQLQGVVLCHWDKEEKSSKLTPLHDLPYQDELLARGQLGDLVTRQMIETYLAPNFEKERQEKAQAWLAEF